MAACFFFTSNLAKSTLAPLQFSSTLYPERGMRKQQQATVSLLISPLVSVLDSILEYAELLQQHYAIYIRPPDTCPVRAPIVYLRWTTLNTARTSRRAFRSYRVGSYLSGRASHAHTPAFYRSVFDIAQYPPVRGAYFCLLNEEPLKTLQLENMRQVIKLHFECKAGTASGTNTTCLGQQLRPSSYDLNRLWPMQCADRCRILAWYNTREGICLSLAHTRAAGTQVTTPPIKSLGAIRRNSMTIKLASMIYSFVDYGAQ